MDGLTALARARAAGLAVTADGDRLTVRGPKRLEPLARELLARKAEVLAALAGPACPRCGRPSPAAGAWCDGCLETLPAPLVLRYPVALRWSAEQGWLRARDPFTGEWHELRAADAPACWRDALRRRRN